MTEFFGALSTLFGKMESFTNYLTERLSASYEAFGQGQRIGILIAFVLLILIVLYIIVLMLRFSFKNRTKKLKNIRREYQITLNRAEGKRCNFVWDLLLYQKMVILDDPVIPQIMVDNKVLLQLQEEL